MAQPIKAPLRQPRKPFNEITTEELGRIAGQAGRAAARETWEAGLPVTTVEDGWVVRIYPDGRRERVEPVE